MKKFELNRQTIRSIEKSIGLGHQDLADTDVMAIDSRIESKTGKKLSYSTSVGGLRHRGSVYLMFNRFLSAKSINDGIAKIKP